ncbi:MAG TPA: hypothetical protein PLD73_02105 [Candidatus Hydrogenedentes bacterium]|jgi:hypothetical protein|nr:hypothetical protein [Candidatus Hydrogenedentota bacterium]HPJ99758.1 hypothetical protein [Candidatus Hydrogenedentota bacterium]
MGCALFMLAALVIIGLLAGLGYYLFTKGLEQTKSQLAAALDEEYGKLIEEDAIPDEHRPLFDELHALGTDPGTSSLAVIMCLAAVQSAFDDGQLTEEEVRHVTEIRDFVKANPQAGMRTIFSFLAEHPEFRQMFEGIEESLGVPLEPGMPEDTLDSSEAASEAIPGVIREEPAAAAP